MNLKLLYKAAQLTGKKHYAEIADTHAKNTARHLLRDDYTTYHVVNIDPATRRVVRKFQQQGERHLMNFPLSLTTDLMLGWRDDSTWSRGQAWAVAGYADSALHTDNDFQLQTALRLADKFLSLLPADGVPPWSVKFVELAQRQANVFVTGTSITRGRLRETSQLAWLLPAVCCLCIASSSPPTATGPFRTCSERCA